MRARDSTGRHCKLCAAPTDSHPSDIFFAVLVENSSAGHRWIDIAPLCETFLSFVVLFVHRCPPNAALFNAEETIQNRGPVSVKNFIWPSKGLKGLFLRNLQRLVPIARGGAVSHSASSKMQRRGVVNHCFATPSADFTRGLS